jgi:uracil phosphoribosyltransferase
MLTKVNEKPSIANVFLNELRDALVQTDRMRFRKNVQRLGEILAYHISMDLDFANKSINTPLARFGAIDLDDSPIIISILRAGLGLHEGILNYFDKSDSGYLSAFRQYTDASHHDFNIVIEYLAANNLQDKTVILCDPMLATGRTIELAYQAICRNGTPYKIIIASILASEEGIEYVQKVIPTADIYTIDIDPDLDDRKYILPGIGDVGDLLFGQKL